MNTPHVNSEPQPILDHPSSIASATIDQPDVAPERPAPPAFAEPETKAGASLNQLNQLLNPAPTLSLQPSTPNQAPAVIDATVLPDTVQHRKSRRTGRVASLPKLQRDMVNHMIWNGVPYKNIVAALDEAGFSVTERNISNWTTGGYLEWRFEHELVLQNRLDQDHLVDHLRRDDASALPETGLQAAATRLSQILLQKTARADNVEANLESFSRMVDVLCRLNREIATLQKQRDDSRRSLGRAFDPARIKENEEFSAIEHERFYSNPPSDSGLAKPDVPPLLPPVPTSTALAQDDLEDAAQKRIADQERLIATLRAFSKKTPDAAADSAISNLPAASR